MASSLGNSLPTRALTDPGLSDDGERRPRRCPAPAPANQPALTSLTAARARPLAALAPQHPCQHPDWGLGPRPAIACPPAAGRCCVTPPPCRRPHPRPSCRLPSRPADERIEDTLVTPDFDVQPTPLREYYQHLDQRLDELQNLLGAQGAALPSTYEKYLHGSVPAGAGGGNPLVSAKEYYEQLKQLRADSQVRAGGQGRRVSGTADVDISRGWTRWPCVPHSALCSRC